MCDFAAGQLIVMRPRGEGPAAMAALNALMPVVDRYASQAPTRLDGLMAQRLRPAWEGSSPVDQPPPTSMRIASAFQVELFRVPEGAELSVVEEIRSAYFDVALTDEKAMRELAGDRYQRLHVAPNWNLHPAAGTTDVVPNPFTLTNHAAFLKQIGLDRAQPGEAQGITVAVLDNGFDTHFWTGAPSPVPVAAGQDLIPADPSTSGHGTLVAALIAASAPGADVVPLRMAGTESTEWDALHALARAVAMGAHVINFSYRQILGNDIPCQKCGLTRTAARSDVFATMVDWASENGQRAILAAAGNDGFPSIARPADYKGATAIAALDATGTSLWSHSNWNPNKQSDVLALPGENVATDAGGSNYSGTSFATAYAAALYAVGMGRHGTVNASTVSAKFAQAGSTVKNSKVPYLR